MANLELQLNDYRLTTAEILYYMPDYPKLIQSFMWQEYDLAPKFPELSKFLDFWGKKIDGKLHSVTVAHKKIITAEEISFKDAEFTLH